MRTLHKILIAKFILTGSKYTEKKISATLAKTGAAGAAPVAPGGPVPLAMVIGLAVVLAAGAAAYVFRGSIFKTEQPAPQKTAVPTDAAPVPRSPAAVPPPANPPVAAPPANDANWMLSLESASIPNSPVTGRIHGQNFALERAVIQGGILTLRAGNLGPIEFGAQISFGGAQAGALAGRTINVSSEVEKAARVTLRWKEGGQIAMASFNKGYALRIEFGPLANNRLTGKLYLCTPDPKKSFLMGTFSAEAPQPKPKGPAQKKK